MRLLESDHSQELMIQISQWFVPWDKLVIRYKWRNAHHEFFRLPKIEFLRHFNSFIVREKQIDLIKISALKTKSRRPSTSLHRKDFSTWILINWSLPLIFQPLRLVRIISIPLITSKVIFSFAFFEIFSSKVTTSIENFLFRLEQLASSVLISAVLHRSNNGLKGFWDARIRGSWLSHFQAELSWFVTPI